MALQLPPNASLLDTRANQSPSGMITDPGHPHGSLKADVLGVGIVMLVVSSFAVFLATFGRIRREGRLNVADWTRLVGLVLTAAYFGVVFALTDSAVHQWDLPVSWYNVPSHIKLLYAETVILSPCIFFSKLSILLLYFELFQIKGGMRYFIWGAILLDFLTYSPGIALVSIYCAPHVGQAWDIATYGNCAHTNVWGTIQGSMATVLDIYIFALPIPTIWNLHMDRSKKIGVSAVFGTASFGIIASVIALVFRVKLYIGGSSQNTDFNWIVYQLFICIMVEDGVALVVSSMPAASVQTKALAGQVHRMYSSISGSKGSWNRSLPESHSEPSQAILRRDSYEVRVHPWGQDVELSGPQQGVKPVEHIYGEAMSSRSAASTTQVPS